MKLPDNPKLADALLSQMEKKRKEDSFIRYWQPFDYEKPVFEKFTDKVKILVVAGGNRAGKRLDVDIPIPTPTGWKRNGDLAPGDVIFDEQGHSCTVTEAHPPVYDRTYIVKFDDGTEIAACADHLWQTSTHKERKNAKRRSESFRARRRVYRGTKSIGKSKDASTVMPEHGIRSTEEIFHTQRALRGRIANHAVALSKPLELPEANLPLDPYALGAWLGDGTTATAGFTAHIDDAHEILGKFGFPYRKTNEEHGWLVGARVHVENANPPRTLNTFASALRKVEVLGNKHIPLQYLRASFAQRLALLQGLMDTDGTVNKRSGSCSFSNSNKRLVDDVSELLHSLGIKHVFHFTIAKCLYKGEVRECESWETTFTTDLPVFRLKRKACLQKLEGLNGHSKNRYIVSVTEVTPRLMRCITTDSPNHLYLASKSMVPTHNTVSGAALTTAFALGKDYFKGDPAWSWVQKLPIPDKPLNNIWLVGLDYKVLKDVIWREKLLAGDGHHAGFLPKTSVPGTPIENILDRDMQIYLTNGCVISGKSADSGREKFQSASVDLVWIDEECDAEIFDECYQRTVDCGGKIIVTVTPLIDINSGVRTPWIYNLWEDMKSGRKDIAFVNLSVLDNPVVPEDEKKKLLEKWKGHPEERARLFGEFVRRSGLVYPMWSRNIHLKRTNPSPDWQTIVSIDPAATGITAALWCRVDPSGNLHLYREYYNADLTVSEHALNIKTRNRGDKVDVWYIDPTWGSQRTAENHKTGQQLYRDAGIPARLAEVGNDFGLLASLEYMQATCLGPESRNPKVFVDPNLTNFIDEIEHYIYDTYHSGPLKGLSKDRPRKKADHLLNAYQYIAAQRPRGRKGHNSEEPPPSSGSYF